MLVLAGRGEFAGTGSLISPTSDHFLLNLAWPKTSPRCWEAAGRLGAVGIQTSVSQTPRNLLGAGEKCLMMGDFSSSPFSALQKGRIEPWLDGGVLAPRWGKGIAGSEMSVPGLGLERRAEPQLAEVYRVGRLTSQSDLMVFSGLQILQTCESLGGSPCKPLPACSRG